MPAQLTEHHLHQFVFHHVFLSFSQLNEGTVAVLLSFMQSTVEGFGSCPPEPFQMEAGKEIGRALWWSGNSSSIIPVL
jgi:hypothetical protein